jgi:ribosome maturation factor RimP
MTLSLDQIRSTAQRVAASHGLDVVEVEYQGGPKYRTLRVFIEKNAEERARLIARAEEDAPVAGISEGDSLNSEDGVLNSEGNGLNIDRVAGVTHDDCQAFSRDFGTVLDVEELIPGGEYTLEVSSPGLDRKLYGQDDYRRFSGSLVKLQTFAPVAGNRHWQGRLTQVSDHTLTLDLGALKQKGKGRKTVAAANQSNVEIEFSNIEKANLIPEF